MSGTELGGEIDTLLWRLRCDKHLPSESDLKRLYELIGLCLQELFGVSADSPFHRHLGQGETAAEPISLSVIGLAHVKRLHQQREVVGVDLPSPSILTMIFAPGLTASLNPAMGLRSSACLGGCHRFEIIRRAFTA